MQPKYFYVSTPIYYPNNELHLGHAYTTVLSDVLARYKKQQGYEVFFTTGSDEHGQKIAKAAQLANITPQEFVDGIVNKFKDLWTALHIDYSKFIRTSSQEHTIVVEKIFNQLLAQEDIYLDQYEGWYCIACEEFVTKSQISRDKLHLLCNQQLKFLQEESYFFKVSKYQEQLLAYYHQHPDFIYPESRMNEMINNFLSPGLQDLSVTRTSFNWGIPVKENSKHIIYVWIDALSNYLSSLGYLSSDNSEFNKYWGENSEIVQFLGKEITRFHAIYWPILLMALNIRLPNKLISHSWITMNDDKMSKSKDNSINPLQLINEYGSDALRFFLVNDLHITRDSNYSLQLLIDSYNSNLVNNLGNLLSRTMTMTEKYFNNVIPQYVPSTNDLDKALEQHIHLTIESYEAKMDQYLINDAVKAVIELLHYTNKYIEERTPWILFTNHDVNLNKVINNLLQVLKVSAYLLQPVLVTKSIVIFQQLNINYEQLNFTNLTNFQDLDNVQINLKQILFPRINNS
ncbi:methionine--tRNA ligase [Spiroplasma endosymbiont of Eupeodes luniger]|uniref:methionine--tRNA ligase n=1 Tax=Spiroplasma endosymbiont of Eupeodes luniger TaxID=3066300 RepID=UPI0030D275BC